MSAIPTFEAQLESYVTVLLRLGVNLQPGQNLIVMSTSAPVEEVAPVMRLLTRTAYEMGARNVHIGRLIELDVDDIDQLPAICERLLANPLIEDYEIEYGDRSTAPTGAEVSP